MTNMWMVKSDDNDYLIDKFKESKLIALGFNLGNISSLSRGDLVRMTLSKYSNLDSNQRSLIVNALSNFKNEIKIGDYVISLSNDKKFILGKISSDYIFNSSWKNDFIEEDNIEDSRLFFMSNRNGVNAKSRLLDDNRRMVLLKGSKVSMIDGALTKGNKSLRENNRHLFKDGITTEDMVFNSPSQAGSFVKGHETNGLTDWKNKNGISIKELENLNYKFNNQINNKVSTKYSDTRSVDWIGEFDLSDLNELTQNELIKEEIVFKIDEKSSKDILSLLNQEDDIMGEKESFYTYLKSRGYLFDKKTVENYLLSLKVKPFVILTGNSGTGKTKLSQLFAEYLGEKVNKEIVIEEDNEEYLNIEIPITQTVSKYLNEGKLLLDKRVLRKILPFDKFEGNLEVKFDEIESNERFYLISRGLCRDTSLKSYFKSISKNSSVKIQIKKDDIKSTFIGDTFLLDSEFKTTFTVGTNWLWNISKYDWNKFLPMHVDNSWNVIINGKRTKVDVKLYTVRLDALKSNNKELLDYLEKVSNRNPKEKLNVTLDFASFTSDYDEKNQDVDEEFLEQESVEIVRKVTDDRELYKIIPVGANWTENRNIIGYHNLITGKYQSTPAYELIKEAGEDDEPYFLILDEMNLSHVERYFADFLSSIESGKPIPLYGNDKELAIPNNLFIIGTVNVDETTYMFSPKVLDRANTIEFDTCDPVKYLSGRFDSSDLEGNVNYLENPLSDIELRDEPMENIKNYLSNVKVGSKDFWIVLSEEINKFYSVLKGAGFDFGFRVIDEIVRFMYVAWKYEGEPNEFNNWQRYFDAQIKQKMLPKLHGSEKVLKKTLEELISLCEKEIVDGENDDKSNIINIPVYTSSLIKLKEMEEVLKSQRYVSFIN